MLVLNILDTVGEMKQSLTAVLMTTANLAKQENKCEDLVADQLKT